MRADDFFNTLRRAIHPDFLCQPQAGKLEHIEQHHDGTTSCFCLKPSSQMVAFSLDKRGKEPFGILAPGLDSKNDLTLVCLDANKRPLVFVIECKNSGSIGNAQHQIECGIAFCKYLFQLIVFVHDIKMTPRFFGVAVYRPKFPPKGTTRPQFVTVGQNGILRATWHLDVELPLTELIRAAEATRLSGCK